MGTFHCVLHGCVCVFLCSGFTQVVLRLCHRVQAEANRTASGVVTATLSQRASQAHATDKGTKLALTSCLTWCTDRFLLSAFLVKDTLPRKRPSPSQLRAAQVVGTSASVSVLEQSHLNDYSGASTLTDYQHEQLHSSVANLVERLQQRADNVVRSFCPRLHKCNERTDATLTQFLMW